MSKRGTNLQFLGRLGFDPKVREMKNGAIFVTFSLAHNPNPKYKATWKDFVCYDPEVCEYIIEHYRKGSMMQVWNSYPNTREFKNKEYETWIVTDVEMSPDDRSVLNPNFIEPQGEQGEPEGDPDGIPF